MLAHKYGIDTTESVTRHIAYWLQNTSFLINILRWILIIKTNSLKMRKGIFIQENEHDLMETEKHGKMINTL